MTSQSRKQQVPAKNIHGDFQIWTCPRIISKNKIQAQAKCQMAGAYTLPIMVSFFSTMTKHIDNSVLKDILQFKVLPSWINIRANSFIKTSGNIMKQKRCLESHKLHKNLSMHFEQNCTKVDHFAHFYTFLFLSNKPSF